MTLEKAIEHDKERESTYPSGAYDAICRPGSPFPYCRERRRSHKLRIAELSADEQIEEYREHGFKI